MIEPDPHAENCLRVCQPVKSVPPTRVGIEVAGWTDEDDNAVSAGRRPIVWKLISGSRTLSP